LRDLGVIVGGLTKGKKRRPDQLLQTVPYLRVANVQRGALDLTEVKHIEATQEEVDALRLQRGDVLFNEGGDRDKLGRGCVWREELPLCIHQNHVFRLRLQSEADPQFVSAYGNSTEAQQYFLGSGKQTTNLASINITTLGALPVCLPPLNEQRRIVAKLESLQERSRRAREALDAVPALLDKLRQSILAAAFRGDLTRDFREKHKDLEPASKLLQRIRTERRKKWEEAELAKLTAKGKPPTDDKWKSKYKEPDPVDTTGLPKLPDGWCWAAWREVGFCQNGRAFPSAEYTVDGTKLLRPGNLHVSGDIEWTDDNTRRMPRTWAREYPEFVVGANELVMNLTAQSLKDEFLGRICLSGPKEECLLNQRIARLVPCGLSHQYWLWFFKSPSFRRYVDTLNTGSLIQHMFTSQIDQCAVPLMPTAEAYLLVERITEKLRALRTLSEQIRHEQNRLPFLDRAILAKAFRGELVPQDPSDEPADVMLARTSASPEREKRGRRPGAKDVHSE
jgi:type I restriction enzyme S subunit